MAHTVAPIALSYVAHLHRSVEGPGGKKSSRKRAYSTHLTCMELVL